MMTVFSAYRLQSLIGRRRRKPRSAWRTKGLQRLSASVADRTRGPAVVSGKRPSGGVFSAYRLQSLIGRSQHI